MNLAETLGSHRSRGCHFYFWNGRGFFPDLGDYVYDGNIGAIGQLFPYGDAWFESPNLWWESEGVWFVATDVDATSTYVGGTGSLIHDIVESRRLEAVEAHLDTTVDEWPGPGHLEIESLLGSR